MEWLTGLFDQLRNWVQDPAISSQLMEQMVNGLHALGLLLGTYFLAKIASRSIASTICGRVDETLGKFIGRLSYYTILIAGTLGILATFKINVAGAMAVLTAAGFAIGLAFQGTLSNFASGVLLLVFRPFKVGDMVMAAGVTGRINEIDLFTTTFDTPDNRRLIVPNSAISSGTIENMTFHQHRRVDVMVGVAYAASLDATRAALTEAVGKLSELMIPGDKRGFQVLLGQLGPSSVDWTIRFWASTDNFALARERLTEEIKLALGRAGIDIPFPQMQLHMTKDPMSAISSQFAPSLSDEQAHLPVRPRMRRSGGEAA